MWSTFLTQEYQKYKMLLHTFRKEDGNNLLMQYVFLISMYLLVLSREEKKRIGKRERKSRREVGKSNGVMNSNQRSQKSRNTHTEEGQREKIYHVGFHSGTVKTIL